MSSLSGALLGLGAGSGRWYHKRGDVFDVTWDEYSYYIANALDSGDVATFVESGPDGLDLGYEMYGGDVPFAVEIILYYAGVDDVSVDEIMGGYPDGSTPVNYARALSLMGTPARAHMLGMRYEGVTV